jgi:hypothetical protein
VGGRKEGYWANAIKKNNDGGPNMRPLRPFHIRFFLSLRGESNIENMRGVE